MQQKISKKTISLAVFAVMLFNVAALPVMAAETTSTENRTGDNFCTRLEQASTKLDRDMADRSKKLDDKNTEREASLTKNRSDRDEKMAKQKSDNDKNIAERYGKMEGKAKNDAQQAALDTFHAAMIAALNVRKAAFDSAQTTFRTGLDAVITARKAGMQAAVTNLQTALKDAETKAKADCAAQVSPITVRATFQAAVKVAKEKFASDRKAVEKITGNLKTLTDARKTAMDKARADFKAAVEKATKDLKATLAAIKPAKKLLVNKTDKMITSTPATENHKDSTNEHVAKKVEAKIAGMSFQPISTSVSKGDTVVWINNDSVPHTVTAADGSFDSGSIAPGATFSHAFTSVGSVNYSCTFHPGMHGSVTVTE